MGKGNLISQKWGTITAQLLWAHTTSRYDLVGLCIAHRAHISFKHHTRPKRATLSLVCTYPLLSHSCTTPANVTR